MTVVEPVQYLLVAVYLATLAGVIWGALCILYDRLTGADDLDDDEAWERDKADRLE